VEGPKARAQESPFVDIAIDGCCHHVDLRELGSAQDRGISGMANRQMEYPHAP